MIARARAVATAGVLLAAITTAGCDDGLRGTIVARGVSAPSVSASALVVPSTLPFQIMPVSGCPFAPPFGSTFSLLIHGGEVPLILNDASFLFFDTLGFASTHTFTRSELSARFGSTLIAAHSRRTFAFQPQFGCGFVGTPHLMSGRLVLVDERGSRHERGVHASLGRP